MSFLQDFCTEQEPLRQALRSGSPYQPLYVKLKLTWHCNLRCKMCTVWQQNDEGGLPLAVIRSLAQELAAMGTKKVHLSGGEVLLRPDIADIVRAFAGQGIRVNLTTNGTLLTPEMAGRLVESGIRNASISVDGATPAVHDALRGKGNWKRTMRGIRNLRRAAKHAHRTLHIRINTVLTRHNYRDLAGLPDAAYSAGADRLTLIPVDDPTGEIRLSKTRIQAYNHEIAPSLAGRALALGMIDDLEDGYPFGREKEDLEWSKAGSYALGLYETQPCYMPWVHALIDPLGRVYPCCMLRTGPPMGNLIAEQGFRAVWEGSALARFRQQMLAPGRRPDHCHACDDFTSENRYLHRVASAPLDLPGEGGPGSTGAGRALTSAC